MTGLILILAAQAGRYLTLDSTQVVNGAPRWVPVALRLLGLLAILGAIVASWIPTRLLWTDSGFLGVPPRTPARLVERPDIAPVIERAVRPQGKTVALTGTGGTGKSTLAAATCLCWRVRRRFPDGVTWLRAGPDQQPLTLLVDLARRLGLPERESSFTSIEQGRGRLSALLRRRKVLIALDDVWERDPLDAILGLAPKCTVIFTSRRPDLARTFDATHIKVDELTQDQALELLARWTDQTLSDLPSEATKLCAHLANLALGVAMTGATISRGRTCADVLAQIDNDLAQVHADMDLAYPYLTLATAIEAGISDLPAGDQHRYEMLAAFSGSGAFPGEAAAALWHDLPGQEISGLLAELTDRSLLSAAGNGWYAAHDLQYAALSHRLDAGRLAAAHRQLIEGYRFKYPHGWSASVTDAYLARSLARHLHDGSMMHELNDLLTDRDWIKARVHHGQVNDLISDYRYGDGALPKQTGEAVRLSAPVLATDPAEISAQLAGRLIGSPSKSTQQWARELAGSNDEHFTLMPLNPALVPSITPSEPGPAPNHLVAASAGGVRIVTVTATGSLRLWRPETAEFEKTIFPATGLVTCIAIYAYGTRALTGGPDGLLRLWDLGTETQIAEMHAHAGAIRSIAVSADDSLAVTGGDDKALRFWRLGHLTRAAATGTQTGVRSVALGKDAPVLVVGGTDGTVRWWNLRSGQRHGPLYGHRGAVTSVSVTADGATAASAGEDGTVRLWGLRTGTVGATLHGHAGRVSTAAISANGRVLVSGGADKTVRAWSPADATMIASWHGDYPVVGCVSLGGVPFRVLVGQTHGNPYHLELRRPLVHMRTKP